MKLWPVTEEVRRMNAGRGEGRKGWERKEQWQDRWKEIS